MISVLCIALLASQSSLVLSFSTGASVVSCGPSFNNQGSAPDLKGLTQPSMHVPYKDGNKLLSAGFITITENGQPVTAYQVGHTYDIAATADGILISDVLGIISAAFDANGKGAGPMMVKKTAAGQQTSYPYIMPAAVAPATAPAPYNGPPAPVNDGDPGSMKILTCAGLDDHIVQTCGYSGSVQNEGLALDTYGYKWQWMATKAAGPVTIQVGIAGADYNNDVYMVKTVLMGPAAPAAAPVAPAAKPLVLPVPVSLVVGAALIVIIIAVAPFIYGRCGDSSAKPGGIRV